MANPSGRELKCQDCQYRTRNTFNLNRHQITHQKDVKPLLQCSRCSYSTPLASNLSRHEKCHDKDRNIHAPYKNYICLLCSYSALNSRKDTIHHFSVTHDITLMKQTLNFPSMDDFLSWKERFERETCSRFVRFKGAVSHGSKTTYTFRCHRDGVFSPRGEGKRHLKRLGSNKINSCCPAEMKATCDNGLVTVEIIETHVGHANDVGRLNLTVKEKERLAAKIASKVDMNIILDEIREDVASRDLKRADLVTKKDLMNIAHQFNLSSSAIKHTNNWTSVVSWAEENKDSAVRFYKPQGVLMDSHPQLAVEDFVLVIANDPQICLLKQYGNDCICMDGTHSLNQYDFELTTLLVIDELRQGFPSAFMLSNKADSTFITIFLESIKEAVGDTLEPSIFVSDMSPVYINAWNIVMLPPKNQLFSAWHLDRAWRKNLSKVNGREKKIQVYKTVRTLLQNGEEEIFSSLMESALTSWECDPDTAEYGKYFRREYSGNVRQWAYCFRKHLGLNTAHLESMHKVLKHYHFQGKKVKRLDLCIEGLMKFTRDQLFGRLITMCRGRLISTKISILRSRHKKSLEMTNIILMKTSDSTWTISSRSSPTTHNIEVGDSDCTCELKCLECNICFHSYKCSCSDSAIKWNICCHIHYMIMSEKPMSIEPENDDPGNEIEIGLENENSDDELKVVEETNSGKEAILQHFFKDQNPDNYSFTEEKKTVVAEFEKIMNSAKSLQDLKIIMNALAPVIGTMKAANETDIILHPKRRINTNKKMSPQKSFFSTRKGKRTSLIP